MNLIQNNKTIPMKKAAVILSGLFLFASITFAQEPQKPLKKGDKAKIEQTTKKDCPKVKDCTSKQKTKCCSHGKKQTKGDPGKK